ncbi:MAG: carbohydrate ABC transporter permease [Paracoccaceae bacterium]|tara:strand:+ start:2076 stop:3293 length:1218 start_codon:yes stop_codon:yes gene_type:complete
MKFFRKGYLLAPVLGAFWMLILATSVSIIMSFSTGGAFKPDVFYSLFLGTLYGLVFINYKNWPRSTGIAVFGVILILSPIYGPIESSSKFLDIPHQVLINGPISVLFLLVLSKTLKDIPASALSRHEFEDCLARFLTGFGYIFFTAIVIIPFYVMLLTSLKNQSELLFNPLDFSLDFSKGISLFRSYFELFSQFNFGNYLGVSFFVSVLTVVITLVFAIPGAYAVARLKFKGRSIFSRSILLIYMVPLIVLALPIYIVFSMVGLRNSIFGILLIYPVTTIPVALYMLQGYFRTIPSEIEESGLMDGLSRLSVIWKITLPLSLPSLASVSLYIFMIAWNEFLLAFMLLDDPSKFTLTRGVAMLDSSEVPRQHLMAGSVVATIPIMIIFLGLERFISKGLTSGSVKG